MGSAAEDCDGRPSNGNLEPALPCDAPTSSPFAASVFVLVVADFENFEEEKTFVAFDLSHDVFDFEAVWAAGRPIAITVARPSGNLDFEGFSSPRYRFLGLCALQ